VNEEAVRQNADGCIRILIADDHALVRKGISMILEVEPNMTVVGEAKDGTQALELATRLRPDVVLSDISMPPPDGIELARLLKTALPETKTIIVSMHEDIGTVRAALDAGAVAYVIKRASDSELVAAIHAAVAGRSYTDPHLAPLL
jgi:DNA-binding NarL/FixJ family response regulator